MKKLNVFLILSLLYVLAYPQDQADKEVIQKIRSHYYQISKSPSSFSKKQIGGKYQLFSKRDVIQKISWKEHGISYEVYLEGQAEKLNFIHTVEGDKQNRYYFRHKEEYDPFPFMERWLDEKGRFRSAKDQAYFERNLQMTALASRVLAELTFLEKTSKSEGFRIARPYVSEVENYRRSLKKQSLQKVKIEEEIEEIESDEPQASPPYTEQYFDEYGDKRVEIFVEDNDIGCATSFRSENKEVFQKGKLIYQEVHNQESIYDMMFGRYGNADTWQVYIQMGSREISYLKDGKTIISKTVFYINEEEFGTIWN
ncbi:MAG: hypothetical protein AAFR87_07635 [Bacteroidota bacterium]